MELRIPHSQKRSASTGIARVLILAGLLLLAPHVWAMSVSPATSTNGSYTVSWNIATGCQDIWTEIGFITMCFNLQVNSGSGWSYVSGVPIGSLSKAFSGMANGAYQYQIDFSGWPGQCDGRERPILFHQ